jgi:hypothetical protein
MVGFMRNDEIKAQFDGINLIQKVQAIKRVFIAKIAALQGFGWSEFKFVESYNSMIVLKIRLSNMISI